MQDHSQFDSEYFRRNYENYELQNPPRKLNFYRHLIETCGPKRKDRRILDIGCAFGKFLSSLDTSWKRWGVDISEFAIASFRAKDPGIQLASAPATGIPFSGPFDAITSFDVLEHVPQLEPVAAYVNANLAEDGVFLFVVPVYDGPLGFVVQLLDKDPTHVHKNSREFWLKWAQEHFEIVEWWGAFRYLTPGLRYYVHWPTRLFRSIAPAVAIVVQPKH